MLKTIVYGVCVMLMTLILGTVLGLQCYECSGPKGTKHDCEVNLGNVNIQNCTPGFVCTLFVSSAGNQSKIHRLCSPTNECDVVRVENSHTLGNVTVEYCASCNTSNCNSADSYLSSFSLISFLLITFSALAFNMVYNKIFA